MMRVTTRREGMFLASFAAPSRSIAGLGRTDKPGLSSAVGQHMSHPYVSGVSSVERRRRVQPVWGEHHRDHVGTIWVKRALDVAIALVLGLLLLPVLAVAMVLIRATSRGPVIYRQQRVGYRCTMFTIYKLRTMYTRAEQLERELATGGRDGLFHKPRCVQAVTPVGRILRRYSVDEIPQLWNVLRGDMSIVGPRPLNPAETERLRGAMAIRRFGVRPGLTGLWQVRGRNLLHDKERLLLDLHYIDNWSLMLDLRILARTPRAVLSGRGAW